MRTINISQSTISRCLNNNEKVIAAEKGVIGECNEAACVIISGVAFDDNSNFYKELNLIVVTKRCCKKVPLKPGYNPEVSLLNFSGCGNDIYVTIDSGGSGGFQFFYIFKWGNCDLKLIISDDIYNSKYNNYRGSYIDYYRAQVVSDRNIWRIDLSCKGYDYLNQIYYADGKLIEPRKIYISGANYTFPQYYQYYDRYALVVYQRITGLYQADSLGYMETTLKFDNLSSKVERVYLKTDNSSISDCMIFQ